MLFELIPTHLHPQFENFKQDLKILSRKAVKVCPFCQTNKLKLARIETRTYRCLSCGKFSNPLTGKSYNQQHPVKWFDNILNQRILKKSYHDIAYRLKTTPEKVIRRNQAIIRDMQQRYPELALWYINHQKDRDEKELPQSIIDQHQAFKLKISTILTKQEANCPHCRSDNTVKIGKRAGFRCKNCRNTFNLLANTPLNRMPYAELWPTFIDLLVAGKNNKQIEPILNLNHTTITRWRRYWCYMMKESGFEALALWCSKKTSIND